MRDTLDDLIIRDAARDIDLVALLELEIYGFTNTVPPSRAELIEEMDEVQIRQLHSEIRRGYGIKPSHMNRVIGHCVANIVGVQLGANFFNG